MSQSTQTVQPRGSDRRVIAGVPVDNLTEDETLEAIDRLLADGCSHYMAVVNASKITAARGNSELLRILRAADLVTADGMSVVWASRLLEQPLKARVTGIDLLQRLVGHAADRGLSVYFLGARDGAVRGAVAAFVSRHHSLRVAGYRDGYFAPSETGAVVEAIRDSGANLLFVAMGSPAQELWIDSNLAATGAQFALGVGGSFDHISGLSRRAPRWMQQAGLEWLYRFAQEPGRLWRRYLIANTKFAWLIARQLLSQTFGRSE